VSLKFESLKFKVGLRQQCLLRSLFFIPPHPSPFSRGEKGSGELLLRGFVVRGVPIGSRAGARPARTITLNLGWCYFDGF